MGSDHLWYDREGHPIDCALTWARLFEDPDYQVLARDHIDRILVSTVWLGIDHNWIGEGPPIIFETMIFSDDEDLDMERWRYATEVEALAGHQVIVASIRERAKGA